MAPCFLVINVKRSSSSTFQFSEGNANGCHIKPVQSALSKLFALINLAPECFPLDIYKVSAMLVFVFLGVRGQSDYPVYHGVSSVNVHENKPPGKSPHTDSICLN